MSTSTFDVAVVGLGAAGSAAAFHLARRHRRIVAFDRWSPPHAHGSTHGDTRIIREAYYEHPLYVPLVRRAYDLWHELEVAYGHPLLRITGGLMVGPAEGALVRRSRESADRHGVAHRVLSAEAVRRRFPAFDPLDEMVAVHEERAGVLDPERCVRAHLELAARAGAELRLGEPCTSWRADGEGVEVRTANGVWRASRLVIAAGAWMPRLVPQLSSALRVERQVTHWWTPSIRAEWFDVAHSPISLWEYATGRLFYTCPDTGDGVKVAIHHEGDTTDPDAVAPPAPEERARAWDLVRRFMPALAKGRHREARTCLYPDTPDGHFVLDLHPDHPQVVIASPCSGHGFKFASAVGEILADLAADGATRSDISPFRVERLLDDPRPAHLA